MSSAPGWHTLEGSSAVTALGGDAVRGLTQTEAHARLARLGPNRLSRRVGVPAWRKLLEQFLAPLVIILIAAALISASLGELLEAFVIGAVVLLNALIGFAQERRAENAIGALDALVRSEATVVRDGQPQRIATVELVEGDVVLLRSGDGVPADLLLLETRELQVEEAMLTGESVASRKAVGVLPAPTPLAERHNLAFAGTAVTYGTARGLVVATGDRTETGRIADLLAKTTTLETPLTRKISELSSLIVKWVLAVSAAVIAIEVWRGRPLLETFHAAVALAVGAIPEGLPAAMTILLAVGVSRMARRGALIRRLPAVETLGGTTVICSDKTGTLTENQMTVQRLYAHGAAWSVSGLGYDEHGQVQRADAPVAAGSAALADVAAVAGLCVDTRLVPGEGGSRVEGDPTEAALLVLSRKLGFEGAAHHRLDVVPFESQHMYMATLDEGPGGRWLHAKGSSDALFSRCRDMVDGAGQRVPLDLPGLTAVVDRLASEGLRVLALARKSMPGATGVTHADVAELTLVGLAGLIDPPREESRRAIATCQAAGIRVKMITGDHVVTAGAIARQLGLEGSVDGAGRLRSLSGRDLDALEPSQWAQQAQEVSVFARVSPEQKLRLVRALQERGEVVAMTGDGVNDAPALKQADLGVAMGAGGTDVARAASAMILTDDNFGTITAAVEEGRTVFDNLRKFIAWTLPTNGGEGLVLLVAVLLGTELPVLPVQLLWINMVTALLLGTTLVFEAPEPGLMDRPPRRVDAPILDRPMLWRTLLMSSMVAAAAFGLFELAQRDGLPLATAQTIAVNAIVAAELGYLFACRSFTLPAWSLPSTNRWIWWGALAMLLAQLAFTHVPFMNALFGSTPISAAWWGILAGVAVTVWLAAELKKVLVPRPAAPSASAPGLASTASRSALVEASEAPGPR